MLVDDGIQTKPTNRFEPILSGAAAQPGTVVYARFTLEPNGNQFVFKAEQVGVAKADTLDDVIAKRMAAGPSEIDVDSFPLGTVVEGRKVNSADIPIDRASCLVIELSPTIAWQFRTSDSAVTQKDAYRGSNQNLMHVNPTHPPTSGTPMENGCRLVFFDVVQRFTGTRQGFNLHVELLQPDGTTVETIFDPDVPDVGGTFPMF